MGVNSGLIRHTGYRVITLGGGYKSFIFMSVIISWIWKQLTDNSKSLSKTGFYLVLLQRNALIGAFIVQGNLEHTFTTILPLSSNQTNTQGVLSSNERSTLWVCSHKETSLKTAKVLSDETKSSEREREREACRSVYWHISYLCWRQIKLLIRIKNNVIIFLKNIHMFPVNL